MRSVRVSCLLLLCTALSAEAQRPNRLLSPLQAYTLPGYVAVEFGEAFAMPEEFQGQSYAGVAINAHGNLLVFSRGSIPFLEFDGDGQLVRSFGAEGMFRRAHGLHVDENGNIWATDVADHLVMKLDADGNVLMTLGTRGQSGAWDEAVGNRSFDQPTDVTSDSAGNIYVSQGHGPGEPRVLKFSPEGRFIRQWGTRGYGPGEFVVAHAIEIDASGTLNVADRENMRIHRYDTDGNYLGEWRFDAMVCAIHLHTDGHLYITTGYDGQLAKLDGDGSVLGAIGGPGTGNGQFGEAHALTLDHDDHAYVADVVNRRIQKFEKR
jgi:sugar lactone lactonase YvrE